MIDLSHRSDVGGGALATLRTLNLSGALPVAADHMISGLPL